MAGSNTSSPLLSGSTATVVCTVALLYQLSMTEQINACIAAGAKDDNLGF